MNRLTSSIAICSTVSESSLLLSNLVSPGGSLVHTFHITHMTSNLMFVIMQEKMKEEHEREQEKMKEDHKRELHTLKVL